MTYYDDISQGYDELHRDEQARKIEIIKKNIRIKSTDNLLDVGCGSGLSSDFLCNVTGLDPSQSLLEIAKKKGIRCIHAKAESIPFSDSSFEIVLSITAAQNFIDMHSAMQEIRRVGKGLYAITILKKSKKAKQFEKILRNIFDGYSIQKINEDKDDIFIIKSIQDSST